MSPLPAPNASVFLSPPRGYSKRIVAHLNKCDGPTHIVDTSNWSCGPRYRVSARAPSPPRLRMRRNRRRRLGRLPTAASLQSSPYLCRLRPPHECGRKRTRRESWASIAAHIRINGLLDGATGASKSLKHPWAQHTITTRRIINAIPCSANVRRRLSAVIAAQPCTVIVGVALVRLARFGQRGPSVGMAACRPFQRP